jgi:hypothetical protein
MIEIETRFPYLGSRDYIHGTSILSAFVDTLERETASAVSVKRLKFQRVATTNGRLALSKEPFEPRQSEAANCTLQATSAGTVWRGLYAETGTPAVERIAVEYPIAALTADKFAGRCEIAPRNRDELIRCLVEANKRFHERSVDGPSQVRFGYIESWSAPAADVRFAGTLEAKNLIARKTDDGFMTINRLSYAAPGEPPVTVTLCFDVSLGAAAR